MSRSQSDAEERLLSAVAERGVTVSSRQLERWRHHGLVPRPSRAWLGRGRGSTSTYPPGTAEAVVAAAAAVDKYRRLDDALLVLFVKGYPVDGDAVRRAYRNHYRALQEALADEAKEGDGAFDIADAAAPKLVRGMLRNRRGRAMRRRLDGYEDSAESVLTSVVTNLLHVLQKGEFLGDEAQSEFARATGLDAIWKVEVLEQGTLADPKDAAEAMARTAEVMRLDAMIETVDDADLHELRDAANELGSLGCATKDLSVLAISSGSSGGGFWPVDAPSSDDLAAVARSAPAWLRLRQAMPENTQMIGFFVDRHAALHAAAEVVRAMPGDLRLYLTPEGAELLEGVTDEQRERIAEQVREIVPAGLLEELSEDEHPDT